MKRWVGILGTLAALAWAVPAHALSTLTGPLGLGAAGLGAAGASVATAQGASAMDWNPDGLAAEGWDLAYDLGVGGPAGSVQQGLGFSSTLDKGLGIGLRAVDQAFPQAGNYQEGGLGLGLAAALGRWLTVGTVQKVLGAEPGGLRGWSMDAGARASLPLGGTWRVDLGLAASDLASSLAWANGLEEVQPSVTRMGLALESSPGTWLALQEDHLDRQGLGGVDQWRVGIQAAVWKQRVALRAGATQATSGPLVWTAGLGLMLPVPGQRWSLDYGVLVPSGAGANDSPRHVASLGWHFGMEVPMPKVAARLLRALADQQRRLRLARIQLEGLPEGSGAWTLQLRDAAGQRVKTYKGQGQAVPVLVWDGLDGAGASVPADGLNYALSVESPRGPLRGQGPLNAPLELQAVEAKAAAAVKPAVRLKGGELAVEGADFNVAALAGSDATGWELRIVDAGGRTVKTIQGQGTPPREVRWEGKDDYGQPVADSLGAGYELRVTTSSGERHLAAAAPLVAASEFPALAAAAQPTPEPAPPCKVLPDHSCDCVFYFDPGSSLLTEESLATLARALDLAVEHKLRRLSLYGHVGEGENDASGLAQMRADRLLRSLVEDERMDWNTATAEGQMGAFGRPRVDLRMER